MEGVRTFLESSTIHGLGYISTTRRLVKVFWVLVVIAGFTGAGILIYQSFQDWNDNPITTTIETRPINEITLPKVTVCPPKNTYTDLNYGLMMTENMTLNDDTRDELIQYASELLYDDLYDTIMTNLSFFKDNDRYYNWYHGYTEIRLPKFNNEKVNYAVVSSAKSGSISTQYYGEKYDSNKVENSITYDVTVTPPKLSFWLEEEVTLHLVIETVVMKDLTTGEDFVFTDPNCWTCHYEDTITYQNSTPPEKFQLQIARDVPIDDVKNQRLELMPGFRFSWSYSGMDFVPQPAFNNTDITKIFVRKFSVII